eukprot:scaffold22329_cov19-Tisochrysis_lutea.AAC.3
MDDTGLTPKSRGPRPPVEESYKWVRDGACTSCLAPLGSNGIPLAKKNTISGVQNCRGLVCVLLAPTGLNCKISVGQIGEFLEFHCV